MKIRNIKSKFKTQYNIFYFLIYFGLGAIAPLLSIYLKEEVHLTGTQIGTIMSIMPIAVVFAQPMWGIINDYFKRTKVLLKISLLLTGLTALTYLAGDNFYIVLLITFMYSVANCAIIPLSDGVTVSFAKFAGYHYSSIRVWGSIGFAASAFIFGCLTKYFGMKIIFIIPLLVFTSAVFICDKLPMSANRTNRLNIKKDLVNVLKIPKFRMFIVFAFLVFGSLNGGNGVYTSLYIVEHGGNVSGVGLFTSIGVAVEVIVMALLGMNSRKVKDVHLIIIGASLTGLRWLIYFLEPSLIVIYFTSVLHGISSAVFISSSINYLIKFIPSKMVTTAITLYGSLGTGAGSWLITFLGGIIYDNYGLCILYLVYSILTFIGVALCFFMLKMDKD